MQNKVLYIVLDDDPTGTQTIHDVKIYTRLTQETVDKAVSENNNMFFLLTNSRALNETDTAKLHENIGFWCQSASLKYNKRLVIISRGDSTLRGHFPLETEAVEKGIVKAGGAKVNGIIFCPFFLEGGRITKEDIHYVIQEDGRRIPAGDTEFAQDKSFHYTQSNLKAYIEEKSKGEIKSNTVVSINPELTALQVENLLNKATIDTYYVVNATSYEDLVPFRKALEVILETGKNFLIRSAASLVKSLGYVTDIELLDKKELKDNNNQNGGIVIIGSHVNKTTEQFKALKKSDLRIEYIEFNQHLVLEKGGLDKECKRVSQAVDSFISEGKSVVVYTRRDRVDFPTNDEVENLKLSAMISDSLTAVVANLKSRPSFVIAKGGITSSDVATKGLAISEAIVIGQIEKGIPVWKAGSSSKFPNLPYIVFPGNVGSKDTLLAVLRKVSS